MSGDPKVWVVGAGGIGSVSAGRLRREVSCTLVDGWSEHVDEVRAHGLQVEYPDRSANIPLPVYGEDDMERIRERPDFVLLAVKSHRTRECVEQLLPYLGADAAVVSLQNGVNEELIAELVGRERTLGAVVDFGAEMTGPGRVRGYALDAGMLVGELNGEITSRVQRLAALFEGDIPVKATANIWGALWSKLTINVQVNALCALSGLPTDRLAAQRFLRRTAIGLAMEAVQVADRLGLILDRDFLDGDSREYLVGPGDGEAMGRLERGFVQRWRGGSFRPSMLQDVDRGRATEIQALNGYVVEKGRSLGVPTPINEAVVHSIRELPLGQEQPDRSAAKKDLERIYEALIEGRPEHPVQFAAPRALTERDPDGAAQRSSPSGRERP